MKKLSGTHLPVLTARRVYVGPDHLISQHPTQGSHWWREGRQVSYWWYPEVPSGDVIWCGWFRSGDSEQNIGEDKACSMCARWEILLMTQHPTLHQPQQLSMTCWHLQLSHSDLFRGAACVQMSITAARWSTASETWYRGTPNSTLKRTPTSRNRTTRICWWRRSESGLWDCWHCK